MPTVIIGDNTGNNFSGTEDTMLNSAAATTNYGSDAGNTQIAKYDSGTHLHLLIRFTGLSNITPPVTVSAATLSLRQSGLVGTPTYTIDMRRLLRNWVEAQATWNIFSTGNSWGTVGGLSNGVDRIATPSSSLSINATTGVYQVFTGLAADVEGFINGTLPNHGWHMSRADAGQDFTSKYFNSSEDSDFFRPYLTVAYAVAAGNSLAALMAADHFGG